MKMKIEPLNSIFKVSISFNKEKENFTYFKKKDKNYFSIEPGDFNLKNRIKTLNIKFIALENRDYSFFFKFFKKQIFDLIKKNDLIKNFKNNENSYFFNYFHKKGLLKRK